MLLLKCNQNKVGNFWRKHTVNTYAHQHAYMNAAAYWQTVAGDCCSGSKSVGNFEAHGAAINRRVGER